MTMRRRIAQLFTIKTRTEAWLVIYAVALSARLTWRHYLGNPYPGMGGVLLYTGGPVFLVGAKLLDTVRPAPVALAQSNQTPAQPASVVVDPGRARLVSVQRHRFWLLRPEIHARPPAVTRPQACPGIERTIVVAERHRSSGYRLSAATPSGCQLARSAGWKAAIDVSARRD